MQDSLDNEHYQRQGSTFRQSSRAFENYANLKKEFSFNRHTVNQQTHQVSVAKYSSLQIDLRKLEQSELIDLIIQQIQENDKHKTQIIKKQNQIFKLKEELLQMQTIMEKKRNAISLLCQTQSKNLNLIQRLQGKLRGQSETLKQSIYQKKYHELSRYMDEYINNINDAQQQFKKNYSLLQGQNKRLYAQLQNVQSSSIQYEKRSNMMNQKLIKYQKIMEEVSETEKQLHDELEYLAKQNQSLRKQAQTLEMENNSLRRQLENCYQNMKLTDRIEAHSQHQISSELDFIRQKLHQNETISKDIIGKYQEKQAQFEKMARQRQALEQLNSKSTQRNKQLEVKNKQYEIQNGILRKKVQSYIGQIESLEKQIRQLKFQQQSLVQQYSVQRKEKQVIKGQLVSLTQQVKFMEDTYRRELQNSEKIREQLQRFWMNKQRKEVKRQVQSKQPLKQINLSQVKCTGQSGVSQSTFDYTQSKVSRHQKSNRNYKQNNDQI